jgi:hypothetical protein
VDKLARNASTSCRYLHNQSPPFVAYSPLRFDSFDG